MTTYNEIKDSHMAIATGDDAGAGSGLTNWINAKAAFIAGELIPVDQLLGWSIEEIDKTKRIGPMSTSQVDKRITTGWQERKWMSKHALQTCQFIWWIMQTAGTPTNEGVPAGYNTHTITITTSSTPIWNGIHFEREGITSNELRYDLMGLLPTDLEIYVGNTKENFDAKQEITIPFSYLNSGASDIAAQAKRPEGAIGTKWKTWDALVNGNGAGNNPSGLTYNSNPLEVDVTNVRLKLNRKFYKFGQFTAGIPYAGLLSAFDYSIILDVYPIGNLLYTLNKTDKASYAGDLDYDFKFLSDATNDYIRFNYDKLYLKPFNEANDWNKYLETYQITLEPYDYTSSLSIIGVDGLDNTHFENP